MSRRRVWIVGDATKPRVAAVAEELTRLLDGRADVAGVTLVGSENLSGVEADLIAVLGGDGAILSATRRLKGNDIPILGINLGKLGFMASVQSSELERAVDEIILDGRWRVSRRMMLEVRVNHADGRRDGPILGLNDAVVERWGSRMLTVRMAIGGEDATTYRGDGVIVATPTGSTAHSLAAGGPIVEPAVEALVVSPMCAHGLANRPLVVSPSETVTLTVGAGSFRPGLAVDGQVTVKLRDGSQVHVARSQEAVTLVRPEWRSYYDSLRNRLRWAGQPPYEAR